MPHYKDSEGHLHFIEDASFEYMLPPGCVQVQVSNIQQISATEKQTDEFNIQIMNLESSITSRRIREAILSGDHSFIESVEAQIAEIRKQLSKRPAH